MISYSSNHLLSKLLNLNRGAPGPQVVHLILKLVIFTIKQRSPKKINLRVNYYSSLLAAKYITEGNVPCFPFTWTKSITKFIQKMLGFKREL